ncbi:MAG: glycine--tRNA ligase subunit beta, partial [Candidatus Omnitrophica bacterium]|nr:glycine--tRNA ligase subunit beta [Candidatus Omnitrophota bacterium]
MKWGEFLLEIGCEDLPDWSGEYFRENWLPLLREELLKKRIPYQDLEFFSTGRRLAVICSHFGLEQEDVVEEVSGPPVSSGFNSDGTPTPVAIGFARAHGVKVEELIEKERKGRMVLVAVKRIGGQSARNLIVTVINQSLARLEIPRAMSWGKQEIRFIRPVRWVLLLLERKLVPGEILGVRTSRKTFGHRIRSPQAFMVSSLSDYLDKLKQSGVLLRLDSRKEAVVNSLQQKISKGSHFDQGQVEQVCRSVEFPLVTLGGIREEFRKLPPEVVGAVINKLRGIPIYQKGTYVNFGIVLEGIESEVIRQNYEKVLADRLDDATFFLAQDWKKPLLAFKEDLRRIVYHPRWGSLYDRVERFAAMAKVVVNKTFISEQEKEKLMVTINLCKNDLGTQMVTEFPSLQGIIGRIYASREGYPDEVSQAIEQHYWPRSAGDRIPAGFIGSLIAVIDRLEGLVCFFLDGGQISGAGDPFGLKRAANGLIDI